MKYISFLLISFWIGTSCHGMQMLDFSKLSHELGEEKGKREATDFLKTPITPADLFRPLVKELNSTAQHLPTHPEAKNSFEGFIAGFSIVLFKNNEKRKLNEQPVFTFDSELVKVLVADDTLDEKKSDKKTKENREKLVQLLTAKLTELKLLV